MDKQRSSSTIKVYAAAIAAFHPPIAGRSVSRDNDIFTKSQVNESPASSYSSTLGFTNHTKGPKGASVWNIAILVLQSTLVENRPAVSTGIGQASRRHAGLEFGPNDSNVFLKPRLGYVPKVLSIPFRAQVIALSALSPSDGQPEIPALPCQGPENIQWAFCLVQKLRTAFCWLR